MPLLQLEGILLKILDYHMKLSHCPVDVTGNIVVANLGT